MKGLSYTILLLSLILFILLACHKDSQVVPAQSTAPDTSHSIGGILLPPNFPAPYYDFSQNMPTQAGFELGTKLFNDGILSADGTISCNFCHSFLLGHLHHPTAHGIGGQLGIRNTPAIFNTIWGKTFMWDGGVNHMDLSGLNAINSPVEMGETLSDVLSKLQADTAYRSGFKRAFGTDSITSQLFFRALSQFLMRANSATSNYDKYIRNEGVTLSDDEMAGMALVKQKCASCHAGDLFTDGSFRNNGVIGDTNIDQGRYRITQNPADKGKFKVPSLRNLIATDPYMHNGSLATLQEVLDHYSSMQPVQNLDTFFLKNGTVGIPLTDDEKQKIITFLSNTLTDYEYIRGKFYGQ